MCKKKCFKVPKSSSSPTKTAIYVVGPIRGIQRRSRRQVNQFLTLRRLNSLLREQTLATATTIARKHEHFFRKIQNSKFKKVYIQGLVTVLRSKEAYSDSNPRILTDESVEKYCTEGLQKYCIEGLQKYSQCCRNVADIQIQEYCRRLNQEIPSSGGFQKKSHNFLSKKQEVCQEMQKYQR